MKRITLFLLLALYLSLQAFAQIRIGVDAGMNLTHFKSSDNYVQKIGGMGTGFQIGGTLDYEFKKHWMLMSGVSFMQTQSRMEMETVYLVPDDYQFFVCLREKCLSERVAASGHKE